MSEKTKLREEVKIKLANLSQEVRLLAAEKSKTTIIQSEIFNQSKNIACYIPVQTELDVWPIIKTIWEQKKNCYIPAASSDKRGFLAFVKFLPGDRLLPSKVCKVLEPEIVFGKVINPEKLELVIVPLLGFSSANFRLGHGGGCYDRAFAFKNKSERPKKPYLLGVGYKCQQVEFSTDSWDVPMDEIVAV